MRITSVTDLMKLKHAVEMVFDKVPENIFIVSPEIFDYGKDQLGMSDEQVQQEIKVYGFSVEREVAKKYEKALNKPISI